MNLDAAEGLSLSDPGSSRMIPLTVIGIASRYPGADRIIPQKTYRPSTQSDHRRYAEEVVRQEPIVFYGSNGETCGIRLSDALSSRFRDLVGRNDPMFQDRGPSVAIGLMVRCSSIISDPFCLRCSLSHCLLPRPYSGQAMLLGVDKYQPAILGALRSPSHVQNLRRMLRRQSNGLSR